MATANHVRKTNGVLIKHGDMGSPSAGDMMRLRITRDYDHTSNTDDAQIHHVVLYQKNADVAS